MAIEIIFSVGTRKNVVAKKCQLNFSFAAKHKPKFLVATWQKLPMFLLRIRTIFPLTSKIKYKDTYHSKTMMNKLIVGHIRSFVWPLTVSSHFCTFSMCKHRFPMCTLQTNRVLSIYDFLFVSSTRRKERIHKRRGAAPPKNKFVTLDV